VVGNDPVTWNREKCIYSMLYSGPEGLEHADLNETVLWAANRFYSFSLHG